MQRLAAGRPVLIRRPQPDAQQVLSTEDVRRQVTVAVVIAVEEPALLLAVQRQVGCVPLRIGPSFCAVDEKSQVQALNRTEPILPRAPGVPARQSHDYERHGVTSLFAPMDVASGVTISTCFRRHRHQEFLRFLNLMEDNLPAGLDVHLVMDNYGTHKVEKVRNWLARHPRYHVHFTPTSGSWLNQVERLFAEPNRRDSQDPPLPANKLWIPRCCLLHPHLRQHLAPRSRPGAAGHFFNPMPLTPQLR